MNLDESWGRTWCCSVEFLSVHRQRKGGIWMKGLLGLIEVYMRCKFDHTTFSLSHTHLLVSTLVIEGVDFSQSRRLVLLGPSCPELCLYPPSPETILLHFLSKSSRMGDVTSHTNR